MTSLPHRFLTLFSLFALCSLCLAANPKLEFWEQQRKGANGGAEDASPEWFAAAKSSNIEYIRLSPSNLKSDSRDFLIGDADAFTGIPANDLAQLIAVIEQAERANMKLIITTFSLPGCRWKQHNENQFDYRLWNSFSFQNQAIAFWRELANALKDYPSIVGYNIINEPHPEREAGFESSSSKEFQAWLDETNGSPADLNRFYRKTIDAIRSADPSTPIFLDSRFHANPAGFASLEPIKDPSILYSFHCYEPWNYTTFRINKDRFSYPNRMPVGYSGATESWTIDDLSSRLQPVALWAKENGIPTNRIQLGELGCDRKVPGAPRYLSDLLKLANDSGWHWAFYSFRSSEWDGMNYELRTERLNWKQWQAIEDGSQRYSDFILKDRNPLWETFLQALEK